MQLNKKNSINFFYIFLTLHLFVWVAIPSITNLNLPLDTIEALAWGSNLEWGFDKHPPASAFFTEIFYYIFGPQDWAYYLLSQIFVIFSFFIVFKFSVKILNDNLLALLSVLLLEGIFFYNFTTPEFNVNVCQLPFWSLVVYYSWKLFEKKEINLVDSILLGSFAAIGFLSKYLFTYLLASILFMFVYLFFIKKDRKFDFKYIISIEVFLVLLVPHLVWLFNNDFITIDYGLARTGLEDANLFNHIKFPLIYLFKQVGILIPFFILSFLMIGKIKLNLSLKDNKYVFLLFINLLPILLMFLTSLIIGVKIRTMWMTPFYLFFGTLVIYIFKDCLNILKIKNFSYGFLIIFLLSPITYAAVSLVKDDKRTDFPGKNIAKKIQLSWNEEFSDPINIVLGDEWHAGNLSYHLKSRPIWGGSVDQKKLDSYSKYVCIDNICVGNK
tara:strand:- start:1550 stop:2872 length:1323 start_codon:yes stop_codon:yes gene_type:complete